MSNTPSARPSYAAAAALLAALASPHAGAQGTVETGDGLAVGFSASGEVQTLAIGGRNWTSPSLPSGFAFRELPGEPRDQAPNGSLETGSGAPESWSWANSGSGTWTWDSGVASSGTRSLRVDVPGASAKRSPMLNSTSIPIRSNTPYTFSYRSRTQGLSSVLNVFIVEKDAAGRLLQRAIPSRAGTNDWRTFQITFVSSPIAASASIKVEIYSGHGTAWIDDIRLLDLFAGRSPVSFGGTVSVEGGVLTQSAETEGLRLTARMTGVGDAIRVDASLEDETGRDRAVELSFRLPLDVPGWSWEQNPVSALPISDGTRYENLDPTFGAQSHSVYPFATVRNPEAAVTLATPMVAQMNRFSYDRQNGLRVTWDLGLSPAAAKTPSRADVTFWVYTQEPRWGFRAAAEKYVFLNGSAFASPVAEGGGAWVIPAGGESVTTVAGSQDFGWAFLEGVRDIEFGNANGLTVLHYVDAAGYFRLFPGYTSQPSYEVLVSALHADADQGGPILNDAVPRSEMARAVINASPHDLAGRYQVFANSYFWYGDRLQIYPASPDADIPEPSMWSIVTRYGVDGRREWAETRGGRMDGIFLDDVTSTFATVENHRRDLWAYSDLPLTFSWETQKVILLNGFSMAEFGGSFRAYLRQQGLVLMGSLNPGVYSWFAPLFDVLGGESQGADTLERSYIRRVLGARRPWSNLFVPADRLAPDAGEVLAYLRQALFLGYFPGFNGAYWNTASAYERDRALFRQYVPLIRTVARAGWRFIPGATASEAAVLLERFDDLTSDTFYLTAHNSGTSTRSVQVTLDGAVLGLESGAFSVRELLGARTVGITRVGADLRFADTLAAGETFVYAVIGPRAGPPGRRPARHIEPRR